MKKEELYTKINISKSQIKIDHRTAVLLIGSCFAENIGNRLAINQFDVMTNPNGIIYNPLSVVKSLKRYSEKKLYGENEIEFFNEKWFSFDYHSSFSAIKKEVCLTKINNSINKAHEQLKICKTLFITFGSAWVYEYADKGIVANCHKIPNKEFNKRLLSVKEILTAFEEVKSDLKDLNIVFTVSPVRHIKDGLHENNLSKSTLLLAISNLVEQNENCHYFPAYELVIDELRDYRFYKDDLVHPTSLAVDFVWGKFIEAYCDEDTQQLIEELQKIKTAVQHRPFNFESEAHQQFITKQLELMDELNNRHPFLNFEEEKQQLKNPI